MNLPKSIEGIASIKNWCDDYIVLKDITGSTISAVEQNHYHGGIKVGDLRLKTFPNNNHGLNGAIREEFHARGLDLTKNKGNQGSDLSHPATIEILDSAGKSLSQLTSKDFDQTCSIPFHCEHITEVQHTVNVFLQKLSTGRSLEILEILDIMEPNSATVTIPRSHPWMIKGVKGFDRYANSPPELNGLPISSREQLVELRRQENTPINQMFDSLRKNDIDWKQACDSTRNKNTKRQPGWKKMPNLQDPTVKKLLKENDSMEIVKQLYPDHLKRRFVKNKDQIDQIAKDYQFSWYK
jgi:hypothetical protein